MPPAERTYQAGTCNNRLCRRDLGIAYQLGGRDRKYCDDNCKQQEYRNRQQDKHRAHQALAAQAAIESQLKFAAQEVSPAVMALLGEMCNAYDIQIALRAIDLVLADMAQALDARNCTHHMLHLARRR